jgi:predicted ATPase/class 3 adenylate cyclase
VSEALERRLVAVMFTDMVGYTALLQADEQASLAKRDRYWHVLEAQHEACGGTIVQRLGDGSLSMFPSSLAAVQAAVAIQQELAAAEVSIRVGIHVGEVIVEPERLSGEAVNIASRIESFAVPGGVMLSDSAFDQIKNRSDLETVRLGEFRLKNVGRPFALYAVSADGIVVPDPEALEGKGERFAGLPSNLPAVTTSLVGRADDIASLAALVEEHRVVTIAGPGGVGKTRVLAELGRRLAPAFLDGMTFVPLADVAEPDGFVPALAEVLDVKEAEGRTLGEGVVALVGDRKALLLLDNLEQIVDAAAAEVARLIDSCPELRIVTTSRTALRIAVEREYQLAPLEVGPAVALFVARAPSLELTPENRAVVEAVCRRLDGLPLALELAAARLRLLTPESLLERLDHALDVLTSGSRDTPGRQQTLRATIEWSHSLLDEREQRLFRRMAVFAGGCTLADVEAVCADPGETCLDELESLVDKALVHVDAQGGRLRLLETIREFAVEQLAAAGEADEIAVRHARRYADVAAEIRAGVGGTRRSRRSSGGSRRRRTSRAHSTRFSGSATRATATRARPACRCAPTSGCTGTSAARTSPPGTRPSRSSTPTPNASLRSGAQARCSRPPSAPGWAARSSAPRRSGTRRTRSQPPFPRRASSAWRRSARPHSGCWATTRGRRFTG